MGFLQDIPASHLFAVYDTDAQQLRLGAEGEVKEAAVGFHFQPVTWPGGLKYTLQAWIGPLTGKQQKYTYQQVEEIIVPNYLEYVIITTLNHPFGKPVKIIKEPIIPPPLGPGSAGQPQNADSSDDVPANVDLGPVVNTSSGPINEIHTPFGRPFVITAAVNAVDSAGSINSAFEDSFLNLTSSGIDQSKISWTFEAHRLGKTQVKITFAGGIKPIVWQQVYNVTVYPLPTPTSQPAAANYAAQSNGSEPSATPTEILSYLGRVNIADKLVTQSYPGAKIYLARAFTRSPKGAQTIPQLGEMIVTFRVEGGIVDIHSSGFGTFDPPVFRKGIILGYGDVKWPVPLTAEKALELLRFEGPVFPPIREVRLFNDLRTGQDGYSFQSIDGTERYVPADESSVAAPSSK